MDFNGLPYTNLHNLLFITGATIQIHINKMVKFGKLLDQLLCVYDPLILIKNGPLT